MSAGYSSFDSLHTRASPTAADRAIRNKVQFRHVNQLWFLLGSTIALFTVVNFGRYLYSRWTLKNAPSSDATPSDSDKKGDEKGPTHRNKSSTFSRAISAFQTAFRITFFRRTVTIGYNAVASMSELTFILCYIAAMFILLLVDTRDLAAFMYQDRAALLASCQLPIIVALAGKNNVISWLTGIGHEKLNVLHRASARTAFIFLWIHALTRVQSGLPAQFSILHNWMRSGALGLAALTIAMILSIRPIRNAAFEFFLVTHIIFIVIFLVGGYYHAKAIHEDEFIWPALLVWAFDRVLRLGRFVWNNKPWEKNHPGDALVELLSEDTIRLTMSRRISWTPGQHAYVILPTVSSLPFEAHPFTIASLPSDDGKQSDVVFLIRGRNGFTKRLRDHAAKDPESRVPAFMDGPYGCPPDLRHYSTCILVAGGSGISYTLPLLLNLIRVNARGGKSAVQRIVFVWAVRDPVHLRWISKTLMEALNTALPSLVVEPRIYITGKNSPIPETAEIEGRPASISSSVDKEKVESPVSELPRYSSLKLIHGRPSMKKLIHDEIDLALGPLSVDVAGPSNLAESIRRALSTDSATPSAVLKGAQPVTLHVETFGMVKK